MGLNVFFFSMVLGFFGSPRIYTEVIAQEYIFINFGEIGSPLILNLPTSEPQVYFRRSGLGYTYSVPCIDHQKQNYFKEIERPARDLDRAGATDAASRLRARLKR